MTERSYDPSFHYETKFENVHDCMDCLKTKIDGFSLTLEAVIRKSNLNASTKIGVIRLLYDLQAHIDVLNDQLN